MTILNRETRATHMNTYMWYLGLVLPNHVIPGVRYKAKYLPLFQATLLAR